MAIVVKHDPSAATYGTIAERVGAFQKQREDFVRNEGYGQQIRMENLSSQNAANRMEQQAEINSQAQREKANLDLEYNTKMLDIKKQNEDREKQERLDELNNLGLGQDTDIDNPQYDYSNNPAEKKQIDELNNRMAKIRQYSVMNPDDTNTVNFLTKQTQEEIDNIHSVIPMQKSFAEQQKENFFSVDLQDGTVAMIHRDDTGKVSVAKISETDKTMQWKEKLQDGKQLKNDIAKGWSDIYSAYKKEESEYNQKIFEIIMNNDKEEDRKSAIALLPKPAIPNQDAYINERMESYNSIMNKKELTKASSNAQKEHSADIEKKITNIKNNITNNIIDGKPSDLFIDDLIKKVLNENPNPSESDWVVIVQFLQEKQAIK